MIPSIPSMPNFLSVLKVFQTCKIYSQRLSCIFHHSMYSPTPVTMDDNGYKALQDWVTEKSKPVIYMLQKANTSKVEGAVCLSRICLFCSYGIQCRQTATKKMEPVQTPMMTKMTPTPRAARRRRRKPRYLTPCLF